MSPVETSGSEVGLVFQTFMQGSSLNEVFVLLYSPKGRLALDSPSI